MLSTPQRIRTRDYDNLGFVMGCRELKWIRNGSPNSQGYFQGWERVVIIINKEKEIKKIK